MKKYFILLIALFGFLMIPSNTFACGSKPQGKCCAKSTTTKDHKVCCCDKNSHSKSKNHDGCNGKCGHSNCVTTSIQLSVAFFEIKFKNNNFDFLEKKQNYFNSETNLSSGFYSLWLIPKIS